jgi:integrase
VPDRLRSLVGKVEEKFSLQTSDPIEAKRKHAEALTRIDLQWANLLKPATSLSAEQASGIAEPVYRDLIASFLADPLQPRDWNLAVGEAMLEQEFVPAEKSLGQMLRGGFQLEERMSSSCWATTEQLIRQQRLHLDLAGRCILYRAVLRATQGAYLELRNRDRYPYEMPLPACEPRKGKPGSEVAFNELLQGWQKEKRPSQKTVYTWARTVEAFTTFLGHQDASAARAEDIIAWKNGMIAAGLAPKTVQFGKLAAIRTLLQWGLDNRRLASNVAAGVKAGGASKVGKTKRSFTDEEARTILAASRLARDSHIRWVPWICAFTGARLSEICQLRKQDVARQEDVWCLKILADAGSLKNQNSERVIPIHPALIEEGFLCFVEARNAGPLFSELSPDRFGSRGGSGTKLIGRWVRGLGITDERISPSHSWRHRFKTLARRHGLALDLVNAITGHGRKDVADAYGEYPIDALARELAKIPAIRC